MRLTTLKAVTQRNTAARGSHTVASRGQTNMSDSIIRPADICVCCGAAVPEGRMICWACEHKYLFEDDMQMKGGNE